MVARGYHARPRGNGRDDAGALARLRPLPRGRGDRPLRRCGLLRSGASGQRRAATERDRVVDGIAGKTAYPVRVQDPALRRRGNGETGARAVHHADEVYQDEYGEWSA
jgi:hypothetical protein